MKDIITKENLAILFEGIKKDGDSLRALAIIAIALVALVPTKKS